MLGRLLATTVGFVLAWTASDLLAADAVSPGEAIYRQKCVACHGALGEGTKVHKTPLTGDKSVLELAQVIAKTMPEDAPGTCTGDDARAVASYIHEKFYSPTAQARNAPARIELSRLTVSQYEQTIADLIDSFPNPKGRKPVLSAERGLKAEYFKGPRFNGGDKVLERVDRAVNFDFGETAPLEKLQADEFSIRWQGSLIAPETGDYEFIVRSEHQAKLFVNDLRQPLVDASIKSGKDLEYRGTIRLLRGRNYSLRLDYAKAKLGVRDPKKNPPKPAASSVVLKWKPPQRVTEVIPEPYLSPQSSQFVHVVQTPFPPDDRSVGYERGTSISKAWDQATTSGAIEVATYVAANLEAISGVGNVSGDRRSKLAAFCTKFAERAFRRPLTAEQQAVYIDRQFADAADVDTAVKQVVLLVLKSPRFLYRELGSSPHEAYDAAARLSFALWDSLPDDELLKQVATGKLANREQLHAQATRMVENLRTRSKVREFLLQWLKLDQAPDLAKNSEQFPTFVPELSADLRTSLELFLDDVVWSEASDFRRLLTADEVPLNGRLAEFYGAKLAADASFENVKLNPGRSAGVLTHPYLLASLAYTDTSSPIHRGVLISRSMLGRVLRPPPEAVSPLAPDVHPSLTTRERVILQTKADACITCHGMINPLGFTLEHFDAVGRFRSVEKGKPINASGQYLNRSGETITFRDAPDLARYLVDSDEAQAAFVSQLFHHFVKQPVRAYGPGQLAELQQKFRSQQFSIRKLLAEIAVVAALPPPKKDT
ncbi:MAG: DUF1592 domain-containing protein [Planctomycetaceae bacterium]|nr:DUF1592 domain-containing protein [Planctomycetaceae bacterium]